VAQDYGFYTPATQATLDKNFRAHLNCTAADLLCLARLPVAHILDAAAAVMDDAPALDAAVALGEELRPVRDGAFVAASLTPSTPFPRQHKPLLLTTVPDEARYTIYAVYDEPVDAASYVADIAGAYGAHEAAALLNMSVYAPPRAGADARVQLEAVGTDAIWRCPTWSLARAWAGAGAHAYVGQFAAGASYPGNDAVPACAAPGAVCHQDDIEIVFGTAPAPGAAQAAATREVQARIRAFVHSGVPNAPGYAAWAPAGTSDVHAIELGKNGTAVPVGACTPTFWGAEVEYDYQVYGL
jgi:carboxylesterase type B